jgi:hypothetical protein
MYVSNDNSATSLDVTPISPVSPSNVQRIRGSKVKLYVNYRFMRGIEQQFLALQKGELKFDFKVDFSPLPDFLIFCESILQACNIKCC